MAVTATAIVPVTPLVPGIKIAVYRLALDTAFASGGEAIDFTADFDEIWAAWTAGSDAAADNNLTYGFDLTAKGTAIAAGTVLLTAYYCTTAGQRYGEYTGDLTSVGELRIVVLGR